MCGIAGVLRFDGQTPDPDQLSAMLARLARRGPDAEGRHSVGACALGHRRLAIIDLSEKSAQPMIDAATGTALVFNGTIYNYPELRAELIGLGHAFHSDGDTEVILRAFLQWGEACVERLYGMFAFAVRHANGLFLARDRFGIKPLYFSHTPRAFSFASNVQALLAAGDVDTSFDAVALHHHFTLHAVVPAPRTILAGIRKLEPGCTLTISNTGEATQRRYWSLAAQRPRKPDPGSKWSDADWTDAIHHALLRAVKLRTDIADVKVGVLLSGGLDSSLIVALAHEAGVSDLLTFSVGFEDQPEERGSEFEYSDPVAAMYGTRHHKYLIPNSEVLKRLPEAVGAMAEPMFGQDAVAFYLLSEQVSQTVKVVQSGQGADEVFGGYFWYPRMAAETAGTPLERFRKHYFDRDHDELLQLLAPAHHGTDHTAELVAARLAEPYADDFLDQVLRLDVTTLITDDPVKRVDNMTMAWGLEARVPFLDQHLVELAAQMPPHLKLASEGKHVLKTLSRGRLPDAVIDRKKGYFPMPALKYVRGEFLDFMRDILNSQACRERGVYQRAYVDTLLDAPEAHHTRIQGSKLWHLALTEYWLQQHLGDRA